MSKRKKRRKLKVRITHLAVASGERETCIKRVSDVVLADLLREGQDDVPLGPTP